MGRRGAQIKAGSFRWAGGVVAFVAALALCRWWLLAHQASIQGLSPGCYFRRLTGWYCPGCGGTRAFFALLRGRVAVSWRMNPLLLCGLAAAGWYGLSHGLQRLSHGRIRLAQRCHMTPAAGWWLGGALLAFWILRNLPWWPCSLLAPGRG